MQYTLSTGHRIYRRAVSTPQAVYLLASCSVFNAVSSAAACPLPLYTLYICCHTCGICVYVYIYDFGVDVYVCVCVYV